MLSVEKGVRKAWLRSLSQWLTENKLLSQSANFALKGGLYEQLYLSAWGGDSFERESFIARGKASNLLHRQWGSSSQPSVSLLLFSLPSLPYGLLRLNWKRIIWVACVQFSTLISKEFQRVVRKAMHALSTDLRLAYFILHIKPSYPWNLACPFVLVIVLLLWRDAMIKAALIKENI